MARTELTPVSLVARQSVSVSADAADLSFAAGDDTDGNAVPCTGKEVILAWNQGVGAATITVTAKTDEYGRSGSIETYSIGADEIAMFGLFAVDGWKQTDGDLYIDVSSSDIKLAIVKTP